MNAPIRPCILCGAPEYLDRLCKKHDDEFNGTPDDVDFSDFVADRVAEIRINALAYMEKVRAETGHVVERAHQFKAGEINGFTLANSVLKHMAVFAKEEV